MVESIVVNKRSIFCQTCIKRSNLGQRKNGLI